MDPKKTFRLSFCSRPLKVLITLVTLAIGFGYGVSLLQVHDRSDFNRQKAIAYFRGVEQEPDMYPPQSDTALVSVAHVHTFSQPVILAVMGLLFALTAVSEGFRIFWIVLSFVASFSMNLAPWLIRDVSAGFMYLLYFGGGGMILAYLVMAVTVLKETWGGPGSDTAGLTD